MSYKLFDEMRLAQRAKVPWRYHRQVRWLPQIGDIVPDLQLDSTLGPLGFHDWAEGHWVYLFSHPGAFTPVCTTELAALAGKQDEFARRGVRLLGLSTSPLEDQHRWLDEISLLFDVDVAFPMAADVQGLLTGLMGAVHPEASPDCAMRKTLIVGPDLKIRSIFEYPILVGRSTDEALRVIDALQTVDRFPVGVPADWSKGGECLSLAEPAAEPAGRGGPMWCQFRSRLRMIADPWSAAAARMAAPEEARH